MGLKFFHCCPAKQVKANHLVGAFVRLTTGVDKNQKARDDRQVHLNFNSARLGAQQMTAAKELFGHSKEQFDQPPQAVRLGNQFGGNIHQAGRQTKNAVAVGSALTGSDVGRHFDFDVANRVIGGHGLAVGCICSQYDFAIKPNAGSSIRFSQGTFFASLGRAVVAQSADVATLLHSTINLLAISSQVTNANSLRWHAINSWDRLTSLRASHCGFQAN